MDQTLGTSSLLAAAQWVEGLLLGTIAAAVATIAVAGFGFLMLSGRIEMRTGGRIVIGCFILFGARTIATGLQTASSEVGGPPRYAAAPAPLPIQTEGSPGQPRNLDPFAGASVPTGAGSCCN